MDSTCLSSSTTVLPLEDGLGGTPLLLFKSFWLIITNGEDGDAGFGLVDGGTLVGVALSLPV